MDKFRNLLAILLMFARLDRMEIRTSIDKDFMKSLQKASGQKSSAQITRDALAIYNWALEEAKQGRAVLSSDKNGANVQRLAMPTLDQIRAQARPE